MDWYSVLSALLLLFYFNGEAHGAARKKIRIHIPQKVKHIHHHKKIYITQHPAQTQPTPFAPQFASHESYAPAFLAEPSVLLPLSQERQSTAARPTAPNLQPLYRARGHYGPDPSAQPDKRRPQPAASSKRIKVIRISDNKKRRVLKKKPKRIVIKESQSTRDEKDSNPTSSFHEDFYSDVSAANHNTFKTVRKPKRVEKYIDGDTEHVHTYSEEHVHQIVYDDPHTVPLADVTKAAEHVSGGALLPLDVALQHAMHAAAYPAVLPTLHPAVPTVHHVLPTLHPAHLQAAVRPLALPGALSTKHPMYNPMGHIGSLGTPSHMQYMEYRPHEATHDHLYHDHGEVIHNMGFEKPAGHRPHGLKMNPGYLHHGHSTYGHGYSSWVPQDNGGKDLDQVSGFSSDDKSVTPKKNSKKQSSIHNGKHKHSDDSPANSDTTFDESIFENVKGYTSSTYHGNDSKKRNKKKPQPTPTPVTEFYKKPKKTVTKNHHHHYHHHHHTDDTKPHTTMSSFIDINFLKDPGHRNGYKNNDNKENRPASSVPTFPDIDSPKYSFKNTYRDNKEPLYSTLSAPYGEIDSYKPNKEPSYSTLSAPYGEINSYKPHSSEATYTDTDGYNTNKYKHKYRYNKNADSSPESYSDSNLYSGKDTKDTYLDSYKYKDIYSSPDTYGLDAFGSSSTENKNHQNIQEPGNTWRPKKTKSKKKSISSQNVSFGGQDHKTVIDHFAEGSNISPTIDTSLHDAFLKPVLTDIQFAPSQKYYETLVEKSYGGVTALQDASNTNFRIIQAPQMREDSPSITERSEAIAMSTPTPVPATHQPSVVHTTTIKVPRKQKKKLATEKKQSADQNKGIKVQKEGKAKVDKPPTSFLTTGRGKYKYGDRLQERYDYEYDDFMFI